eukprot:364063_1
MTFPCGSIQWKQTLRIQLVIILIQIYRCCSDDFPASFYFPAQYVIYEHEYTPQSQLFNNQQATASVKGMYTRIDLKEQPMSDSLVSDWRKQSPEFTYDVSRAVHFQNFKGSDLIMYALGSDKCKWYLRTEYTGASGVEPGVARHMGTVSSSKHLIVYPDSTTHDYHETLKITSLYQLKDDLHRDFQFAIDFQENKFPHYPDTYTIYLQHFGFYTLPSQHNDIDGIYQSCQHEPIRPDLLERLRQLWNYNSLAMGQESIHKYHHAHFKLFVLNTEDKREYDMALYDTEDDGIYKSTSETADLFVMKIRDEDVITQLLIYNTHKQIERPQLDVHVPTFAIYLMMALSGCFVLLVLTMIIRTWCVQDYQHSK